MASFCTRFPSRTSLQSLKSAIKVNIRTSSIDGSATSRIPLLTRTNSSTPSRRLSSLLTSNRAGLLMLNSKKTPPLPSQSLSHLLFSRLLTFQKCHPHANRPVQEAEPPSPLQLTSTLLTLLKQCNSIKPFKQIHSQMLVNSIHKHNFLLSKLILLKDFPYASLIFSQISEPNDFSFNVMIRGLTNTWHNYALALQLYYHMKFTGLKPNNFTYPFMLIACGNIPSLDHGRLGHSCIFKLGLHSDAHVAHSLITMYSRCGELDSARKVFDEIVERDLVSWNAMISGYSRMGFAVEAVGLFRRMRVAGFQPDEMTVVSVLGACGDLGDVSLGKWVEGFVESYGLQLNSFLGSALIDMYGKCGDLESARRVFNQMPVKDLVAWNSMITGYAQNGESNEAILLFHQMEGACVDPDKITLISVLSACASIGALDLGKRIAGYASEKGLQQSIYVGTGLIDMYAKCGDLDHAREVFDKMPQRNVVSWNAMISGLAVHGRAQEAILLFECMLEDGSVCPNDITFVGVLSACVHAGLVDEGRRWFYLMHHVYGLVPKVEHYSCMVDLLARSGCLLEAWDFIEKMPEKPDAVMLGALLGACKNFGNVEVSERVVNLLLDLEPSNSGNYVISAKIYANSKKWDDSARMRGLMRERGVTKTPGCSWVEIDNELHEFHAGESYHVRLTEIVDVIILLKQDMKLEEDTSNVLCSYISEDEEIY